MTAEDLYLTDGVNRDALVTLAQRAAAALGRDQRLHVHPAGERCNDRCEVVSA